MGDDTIVGSVSIGVGAGEPAVWEVVRVVSGERDAGRVVDDDCVGI